MASQPVNSSGAGQPTLRPAILAARLPICTVVVLNGRAYSGAGWLTTGSIAARLNVPPTMADNWRTATCAFIMSKVCWYAECRMCLFKGDCRTCGAVWVPGTDLLLQLEAGKDNSDACNTVFSLEQEQQKSSSNRYTEHGT
jgi:hypothetical protein